MRVVFNQTHFNRYLRFCGDNEQMTAAAAIHIAEKNDFESCQMQRAFS